METHQNETMPCEESSKPAVCPAQPNCLLSIGSQRLPAAITDESDTDLHVLVQGSPLFWVEDTGVLRTPTAEITVRVSNIVRREREEDFVSSMPGFCVGLARLGQTAVPSPPHAAPGPATRACPDLPSRNHARVSLGGLIWFAMIATPVVVAGVAWRHHYQQVHASDLPSSDSAATDPAPTDSPSLPPAKSQEAATATQPNPALDLSNLLRLPGVEPLLNAEVARKLALTPSQMGAFERLNETTKEALQDLEKYWESVDRLELARRRNVLMEAARNEALQLLSDEQRQQWEAMTR